jgi:flavin-dependent dehydrogenase
VEKRKLPRDKVCTGMIMGGWARDVIAQEFGEIPREILAEPYYLRGIKLHIGNRDVETIANPMPIAWRKDLDYWMCQKATEAGAEVRDMLKVTGIGSFGSLYEIQFQMGQRIGRLYSKYIVGADGAFSTVRKSLFPHSTVSCRPVYRECYEGQLALAKDYFHWFFPFNSAQPRFDVNHKGRFFLLEGGAIRLLKDRIFTILKEFGFQQNMKPIWRDGCLSLPSLEDSGKRQFVRAKDNALLVGDAACLIMPITQEGIGTALKSGRLAAESIIKAARLGVKADTIYARELRGIEEVLQHIRLLAQELRDAATEDRATFRESLVNSFNEAIRAQGTVCL